MIILNSKHLEREKAEYSINAVLKRTATSNQLSFLAECKNSVMQDLHIIERLGRGATSYVFKVSLNKAIEPNNSSSTYVPTAFIQAMKVIDKNNPRY